MKKYGLRPEDSDWIASQYGRAYLNLDMYQEAEAIFRGLVAGERVDPYHYVYLARALQQHGALSDAIQVLKEGHSRVPDNLAIKTSLGADLERERSDEEALAILEPIFDEYPNNTRAALTIIRIHIRHGLVNVA